VKHCHEKGIRLISDTVMAFGYEPYAHIDYEQFHLRPSDEQQNPDAWQSPRKDPLKLGSLRNPYGGESWRYDQSTKAYDPQSGDIATIAPVWTFHRAHLAYWMSKFQLGGLRLDSLNNVANWDFIAQFRTDAYEHFADLYPSPQNAPNDVAARFIVIGEELSLPIEMITRENRCVDALWNEQFQKRVRASCVGQTVDSEDFGQMVREMINCRLIELDGGQFPSGVNAVNYITNHDTEGDNDGWLRDRFYNFLDSKNVADKEPRCKLAFACLLTAVGIPMIFAGEEFCDQSDQPAGFPYKERDPVDYSRKNKDPWRTNLFNCVARLVALRKRSTALGSDDVSFIYYDFNFGRRIVSWVRGTDPTRMVVVVANFSDAETGGPDYTVTGFPSTPAGMKWRNVMNDVDGPADHAGHEPLGAWEAKVYEVYNP
jgi:pullulanase